MGRKMTSPRTEKQEESSGELAHGSVCCQRKYGELKILPSLPAVFTSLYILSASLALNGCGTGNRDSRSKTMTFCHTQPGSKNKLFPVLKTGPHSFDIILCYHFS